MLVMLVLIGIAFAYPDEEEYQASVDRQAKATVVGGWSPQSLGWW